jgi:enamine deaminase RidA (YjgF/YER057c/UK114 family)
MISVELTVLENRGDDTKVTFKKLNETPYTVVESSEGREIYAGGISGTDPEDDLSLQVEDSYKLMKDILTAESFTFSDIVRQWNYVENIVEVQKVKGDKPIQNYQVLNDTRSLYYSQSEFQHGYPAATGIGMNYGGILLEFYAVKPFGEVEILPIKNPKQVDAYNYSQEVLVGDALKKLPQKTTPKFERAKYLSLNGHRTIFISGTASIHNEITIGIDDVEKQTLATLENISELVTCENLRNSGASETSGKLSYNFLRIYVKKTSDLATVKSICDNQFNDISVSYLIADICRDNLLVEIEGVAEIL